MLWLFSFTCREEHQKVFEIRTCSLSKHSFTIKIFPVNLVAVEPQPPAKYISPEPSVFSPVLVQKSHSRSFLKATPVPYVHLEIPRPGNALSSGCFGSCGAAFHIHRERAWAATVTPASLPPRRGCRLWGFSLRALSRSASCEQPFAVLLVLSTMLRQDKKINTKTCIIFPRESLLHKSSAQV